MYLLRLIVRTLFTLLRHGEWREEFARYRRKRLQKQVQMLFERLFNLFAFLFHSEIAYCHRVTLYPLFVDCAQTWLALDAFNAL